MYRLINFNDKKKKNHMYLIININQPLRLDRKKCEIKKKI